MTTMKKTPGPERAYKAWYKEMLAALKERWHEGLSWPECEALCGEMTAMRAGIREERGIKPPRMFCHNCQAYHEMKNFDVSVRALLFALKKVGAVDESKLASLDKAWQQEERKRKREMAARALASAPTGGEVTSPLDDL
jgi:hypothetical protein